MQVLNKHFGKATSILILSTTLLLNLLGLNLSYNKFFINFNVLLFVILIILFFILVYFFYNKFKNLFNITFLILLFSFQAFFISKFSNIIELQNKSLSVSEKNASMSLSWVILVPTLLILFLFFGIMYDVLRKKLTKKNE